jgi:transposase
VARYKDYDQEQTRLLPVSLTQQIQPGTIEYTITYLVDREVDLSVFDSRYRNDLTGAPAIDPAILLKIILFAYSRGVRRSRQIAQSCEENVVFMALSSDTRPHFTTIADFISSMSEQIIPIFRDVLAVCYTEGLIGRTMFAVDGCKIASNCAKEWSGTKKELKKKAEKIEQSVRLLVEGHRAADSAAGQPDQREKENRAIENLQAKASKIRSWLDSHEERIGTQGKPVKSNIVDNESAKMPSSHGVIQGYNAVAVVDEKHQIVVDAEVFGDGHEARHLSEVLDSVEQTFTALDASADVLHEVVLTADSGFHSEESVKALLERRVDAYVADNKFRLRDPRFASLQEHRRKSTDRSHSSPARRYFAPADFPMDEVSGAVVCPAGHPMKCSCRNFHSGPNGFRGKLYKADAADCADCTLRSRCIRNPHTKARQMAKLEKGIRGDRQSYTQKMIERFDSARGRYSYSRRMGTVEPVFANIRSTMNLDRFTLRGRRKVGIQWMLFCMVHNIGKLARHQRRVKGT